MMPCGPPLVALLDRERALREIGALLDEARARGDPPIIRLAGPAGIGKTALLRHAVAACAARGPVWCSSAEPGDRARPGTVAAALLGLARADAGEDALREAMRAALPREATVCVDDIQWLDEISLRVLRDVMHERGASVGLLLGDRREDAPELPRHRTVRLAPLRTSAAAQLVRRRYAGAPAEVVDEIIQTSTGLPFAIELLADEAARQRARARHDTEPSVETALARRLDRCDLAARDIVRACALLGGKGELAIIARALELPITTCSHALTELADLVWVDTMQLGFRHQAIADAVRASVVDPVPLFARLARAYDPHDERPQTLAALLRCAAGTGDDAAAAAYALRLGRALAASGALTTALEYFATAKRHAPRPLPAEYALAYAGVFQQLARDEEAATFLQAELRGAIERRDTPSATALLVSYGATALTLERLAELDASCERVFAIAESADQQATVSSVRLFAAAFSADLDAFDRLFAVGEPSWRDLRLTAFVCALRGDERGARNAFERYQAGLRPAHDAHAGADRALGAMLGLLSVGNSALVEIDSSWRTDADPGNYATGTAMRILARLNDGRWNEADEIVARLPLGDDTYWEPYTVLDARLLFAAIARRPPAAIERSLRALRSLIARGRARHAIAAASWFWVAAAQAGAAVPNDIRAFVSTQLSVVPMPYLLGGFPLYLACLAPWLGHERCTAALAGHERFTSAWHRAHADLARGLLTRDHERLRRARDAFDALDAPALAMLAGMELPVPRAIDAGLAARLGRTGGGAARPPAKPLTKRERDVAELAAQGLSNREIGQRLAIEARTVEAHLTSAFRKLRVSTRSGLTGAMLHVGRIEP